MEKEQMETSHTNFVTQYTPGKCSRVGLINGLILDVINGRYLDAGTVIILQDGRIKSIFNF